MHKYSIWNKTQLKALQKARIRLGTIYPKEVVTYKWGQRILFSKCACQPRTKISEIPPLKIRFFRIKYPSPFKMQIIRRTKTQNQFYFTMLFIKSQRREEQEGSELLKIVYVFIECAYCVRMLEGKLQQSNPTKHTVSWNYSWL